MSGRLDVDRHELTVPAEAGALKQVRSFLGPRLKGLTPRQTEEVVLAVDECCANVIRHRNPDICDGRIHLSADVGPDRVIVRIRGYCRREDIPNIRPRALEDVRPGGLGTHFVNRIMDRVAYIPDEDYPDSMTLVMEKSLDGGGEGKQADA